jgi:hypothetical protein
MLITEKLPSFMIFVAVFPCFLVYFSLFSSVLNKIPAYFQNTSPQSCSAIFNHCLVYVILCLNAPRKPHAQLTT